MTMNPLLKVGLLALGPALGLGIARFAYGLLLPPMREDLGWSYSEAGWMNTINAIGYILGATTAAVAARRLGAARTYGLGAVVTVLAVLALGATGDFTALSVFRLLSGISGAWIFVTGGAIAAAIAADHPDRGAVVVGLFYAGAGFGIALTGLFVPQWLALHGAESWRSAWFLLGAAGILFAVAGYAATSPAGLRGRARPAHAAYQPLVHKWILVGYAAFGAGSIGYMTFMVAYLRDSGRPAWHTSAFWMAIGLSSMTAPWLWARMLARRRHAHAFAILVGLNALGAAIPLCARSFPAAILSAVVFGAVFFTVVAATTDFIRRNVVMESRTTAIGVFTVSFGIGQTLGPFAIGLVIDATGSLATGLAFGCALIVAGSALSLLQKDG
ncbi:YbfB/YjiJ family MFS transporter [Shinella pollutisoli]|uniref:YbfB/YjiJ family MFS transporter n=1 Tax=Shinella pollutisoli TaxID=2250594 RepID=A0ABV7DP25_9HYPH|nr:YbfB/YjiJ family MFS transporter [Shinella pollutisoli]